MGFSIPSLPPIKLPIPDIVGMIGQLTKTFDPTEQVGQVTGNIQAQQGAIEAMRGKIDKVRKLAQAASAQADVKTVTSYASQVEDTKDVATVVAFSKDSLQQVTPDAVKQQSNGYFQGLLSDLQGQLGISIPGFSSGLSGVQDQLRNAVSGTSDQVSGAAKSMVKDAAVEAVDMYIQSQSGGAIPEPISHAIAQAAVEAGSDLVANDGAIFNQMQDDLANEMQAYAGESIGGTVPSVTDIVATDTSGAMLANTVERSMSNPSAGMTQSRSTVTYQELQTQADNTLQSLFPEGVPEGSLGGINLDDNLALSTSLALNALRESAEEGDVQGFANLANILTEECGVPVEFVGSYVEQLSENLSGSIADQQAYEKIVASVETKIEGYQVLTYEGDPDGTGYDKKISNSTVVKPDTQKSCADLYKEVCASLARSCSVEWVNNSSLFGDHTKQVSIEVIEVGRLNFDQWEARDCNRKYEDAFPNDYYTGTSISVTVLSNNRRMFVNKKTNDVFYPIRLRPYASCKNDIYRRYMEFLNSKDLDYTCRILITKNSGGYVNDPVDSIKGQECSYFYEEPNYLAFKRSTDTSVNSNKRYYIPEFVAQSSADIYDEDIEYFERSGIYPNYTYTKVENASESNYSRDWFIISNIYNYVDAPTGNPSTQNYYEIKSRNSLFATRKTEFINLILNDFYGVSIKDQGYYDDVTTYLGDSTSLDELVERMDKLTCITTSQHVEFVPTKDTAVVYLPTGTPNVTKAKTYYHRQVVREVNGMMYYSYQRIGAPEDSQISTYYELQEASLTSNLSRTYVESIAKQLNTTEKMKARYSDKLSIEAIAKHYNDNLYSGDFNTMLEEITETDAESAKIRHRVYRSLTAPNTWIITVGEKAFYVKADIPLWIDNWTEGHISDYFYDDMIFDGMNINTRRSIIIDKLVSLIDVDANDW